MRFKAGIPMIQLQDLTGQDTAGFLHDPQLKARVPFSQEPKSRGPVDEAATYLSGGAKAASCFETTVPHFIPPPKYTLGCRVAFVAHTFLRQEEETSDDKHKDRNKSKG